MSSDDDQMDDATYGTERRTMRESASGWLQHLWTRLGLAEQPTLRDKLEVLVKEEAKATGGFSPEERKMLSGLLRFGASRVDEIMVPRADIIAIEEMETLGALIRLFEESGVSRIPIYHDTLDDPRGMVHIKDVMAYLTRGCTSRASSAGSRRRWRAARCAIPSSSGWCPGATAARANRRRAPGRRGRPTASPISAASTSAGRSPC